MNFAWRSRQPGRRFRRKRWVVARGAGLGLLVGLLILLLHWPFSSEATPGSTVLISALYYDGYAVDDRDDAFQLTNVGSSPVDLRGWRVGDGRNVVVFPDAHLPPGGQIWITRSREAFIRSFGFVPDWVMDRSQPLVPALGGQPLRFGPWGGEILLWNAAGHLVDALVYEAGRAYISGWEGPAVDPYTPSATFAERGQVLYRKLDASGRPLPDTDTRADWAQDPMDPVRGRRVRYPGWISERLGRPVQSVATATLTVAIGPDHLFETITRYLREAQEQIRFHGYTLEHPLIAATLAERAGAGVDVRVLLEDGPAGGISWAEMWAARTIEQAGGRVYLMVNRPAEGIYDRYRVYHPKGFILDRQVALIGSENPSLGGMPSDDRTDGTAGHRGVYLITDAPAVVSDLQALFDHDLNPRRFRDIQRWPMHDPAYQPPEWYVPQDVSGGDTYSILWPTPLVVRGAFAFELITAPENHLVPQAGLLGLLAQIGAGDTLYVQQLHEPPFWGPAHGTPATDPNVRLEAYIEAARRGARVRILLDAYFDDPALPRSNQATVEYLRRVAREEQLDLRAWRSNLTGLGIHNKMVLAQIDGRGYIHVGSLNGGEASNKVNREVALQVQSDAAYEYLASMFEQDWALSVSTVYLPLTLANAHLRQ